MIKNFLIIVRKAVSFQRVWQGHIIKCGAGKHHKCVRKYATGKGFKPPDDIGKCEKLIKYIFSQTEPFPKIDIKPVSKSFYINKAPKADKTVTSKTNDKEKLPLTSAKVVTSKTNDKEKIPLTSAKVVTSKMEDKKQTPATLATAASEKTTVELEKIGLKERIAFDEKLQNLQDDLHFGQFDPKVNMDCARSSAREDETAQKIEKINDNDSFQVEPNKIDIAKLLTTSYKKPAIDSNMPKINRKAKHRLLNVQNIQDNKSKAPRGYPALYSMITSSKSKAGNYALPKSKDTKHLEMDSLRATASITANKTNSKKGTYHEEDDILNITRIVKKTEKPRSRPRSLTNLRKSVVEKSKKPLVKKAKVNMIVDKSDQNSIANSASRIKTYRTTVCESKPIVNSATKIVNDKKSITGSLTRLANYLKPRSKKVATYKKQITKSNSKLAQKILSNYNVQGEHKLQKVETDKDKNIDLKKNEAVVMNKTIGIQSSVLATPKPNIKDKAESKISSSLKSPKIKSTFKAGVAMKTAPKLKTTPKEEKKSSTSAQRKETHPAAKSKSETDYKDIIPSHESLRSHMRDRINQIGPMLPSYRLNCSQEEAKDDPYAARSTLPAIRVHEYENDSALPLPKETKQQPQSEGQNYSQENKNWSGYTNWQGQGNWAAYGNSSGYGNSPGYGYSPANPALYSSYQSFANYPGFGNYQGFVDPRRLYQASPNFGNQFPLRTSQSQFSFSQGYSSPSWWSPVYNHSTGYGATQGSYPSQRHGMYQWSYQPQGFGAYPRSSSTQVSGAQGSNTSQAYGAYPGFTTQQGYGMYPGSTTTQGSWVPQGSNTPQGSGFSKGSAYTFTAVPYVTYGREDVCNKDTPCSLAQTSPKSEEKPK